MCCKVTKWFININDLEKINELIIYFLRINDNY
jgi:hypothetical protein